MADEIVFGEKREVLGDPVGWRLLLEIPKIAEKTKGNLIVPEEAREKHGYIATQGKVVKIGPSCYTGDRFNDHEGNHCPWCKVGDTVEFIRHSGVVIPGYDENYRVINDEDVLMVIPEK